MTTGTLLDAALAYSRRRLSVIPLLPRDKRPAIPSWEKHQRERASEEQIRRWWGENPAYNIGVVTGGVSGLVVLDLDGPEGRESVKAFDLPPTPIAATGRGQHWYFRHPGGHVANAVKVLPGCDVKADGGYVVAPPSIHPSGARYTWLDCLSPNDVDPAPLPEWVLERLRTRRDGDEKAASLAEPIPEGSRNATLASLAGSLRKRGMDEATIFVVLQAVNRERCRPPLPEAEVKRIAASITKYPTGGERTQVQPAVPETFTASALMSRTFPEPRWVVPGYLPEGLTLLAGRPKMGKSWLALGLAVGVASGGAAFGKVRVERGESLYLALEDTPKRLQSRLGMMLHGEPAPDGLHLACAWPRLDQSGLQHLEAWLEGHKDARLLVADTLQKVRPPQDGRGALYAEDYMALSGLKALADKHGVAVLVVHHLRKGVSEDPLEQVSGTTGLTGAADSIWVLRRDRGRMDATLFITGRDIEEQETALQFDGSLGLWHLLGDAEAYRMSRERQQIVEVLRQAEEPLRPKDIADSLGKREVNIRFLLSKLVQEGAVRRVGYGQYTIPTHTTNSANTTNGANTANSSRVLAMERSVSDPPLTLSRPETRVNQGFSESVSSVSGVSEAVNGVNGSVQGEVAPKKREVVLIDCGDLT